MSFVGAWKASATVISAVIGSELLVSFALTLAMHSTIVLGCAWLLNKVWRGASDAHREYLWRGALIAAVLGPVLQFALHAEPAAGHVLTLDRAVAVPALDVTSPTTPTARTEPTEVLTVAAPVQPQLDTPIETSHSPIALGAIAFALLGILAALRICAHAIACSARSAPACRFATPQFTRPSVGSRCTHATDEAYA